MGVRGRRRASVLADAARRRGGVVSIGSRCGRSQRVGGHHDHFSKRRRARPRARPRCASRADPPSSRGPATPTWHLAASGKPGPSPAACSWKTMSRRSATVSSSLPITISWWSPAAGRPGLTRGPAQHCRRRFGMRAARRSKSATRTKPSSPSGQDQSSWTSIAAVWRRGPSCRSWRTCRSGRAGTDRRASRASALNLFDARYAYNFGNPFSGTHFGAPRTFSVTARVIF